MKKNMLTKMTVMSEMLYAITLSEGCKTMRSSKSGYSVEVQRLKKQSCFFFCLCSSEHRKSPAAIGV